MDVLVGRVARHLAALEEQMDRALEQGFGTGLQLPRRDDSFRPAIDIYESSDAMVVRVELAGVRSEDIRLTVDGEYLQISGRRHAHYDKPPKRYVKMEISEGGFERVLKLAGRYDSKGVTARLENGLLTVELPRSEPEVRRVPVKSE
jgi:HSP20 family protein